MKTPLAIVLMGCLLLPPSDSRAAAQEWVSTNEEYVAVREHKPGALLELQVNQIGYDLSQAYHQYLRATGGWPPSLAALDAAGFMPFQAVGADGQPMPLVELAKDALPSRGEIGLRGESFEVEVVAMGLGGDPAAPYVGRSYRTPVMDDGPQAVPGSLALRRMELANAALRMRLQAFMEVEGRLPNSLDEMNQRLGWRLNPAAIRGPDAGDPSVEIAWDPEGWWVRSKFSAPATYSATTLGRFEVSEYGNGNKNLWLKDDPLKLAAAPTSYPVVITVGVLDGEEPLPVGPAASGLPPQYIAQVHDPRDEGVRGLLFKDLYNAGIVHRETATPIADLRAFAASVPWLDFPLGPDGGPGVLHLEEHLWPAVQGAGGPNAGSVYLRREGDARHSNWRFGIAGETQDEKALPWPPGPQPQSYDYLVSDPRGETLATLEASAAALPKPWTPEQEDAYCRWRLGLGESEKEMWLQALILGVLGRLTEYRRDTGELPESWDVLLAEFRLKPVRYVAAGPATPFAAGEYGFLVECEPSGRFARVTIQMGSEARGRVFLDIPAYWNAVSANQVQMYIPSTRERDVMELQFTPAYRFTLTDPQWSPVVVGQ